MKRLINIFRRPKTGTPVDVLPDQRNEPGKRLTIKPGPDWSLQIADGARDELIAHLSGSINMANGQAVRSGLELIIRSNRLKTVVLDLGAVEYFDSAGTAVLMEMCRLSSELNCALKLANVPDRIRGLVDPDQCGPGSARVLSPRDEPGVLVQIGDGAIRFRSNTKDILAFLGGAAMAMFQDIARPGRIKWESVWRLIEKSGSDAVPISTLLSFLMGAILAFQAAIQLRKFGANIFVADLVSVSICLEMGPLLTALIVAGRSGAGYAAHIGTMQVTEEIDALRIMGIDPTRYLVSPRIVAVGLALPCLTLMSDLMGVFGGCLVASLSMDITPTAYFNQVHRVLEVSDIAKGLVKSFVFGIEIALIGCFRGFQVRGGAESVGSATTSAVVTSIFVLTVTDAIFAMLFHYMPRFWAW